jgi:hypothetical protein
VVRNIWYNVGEVRKIIMKGLVKGQKGQALVAALIVLVIGGLILTPLLGLMGTGIKSGQVFEQKVDETYAADAGVEDAMWHIRNNDIDEDDLLCEVLGAGYNHYDYSSDYSYVYDLDVNDKDVNVTMQNVWMPKDISVPNPTAARDIIEGEKLTIIGYPSGNSTYVIKIVWNGTGAALKVKTIGLWLSPGFQYDGLINGNQLPSGSPSPGIAPYKGGTAVVWNFTSNPPSLSSFPGGTNSTPVVKTVTFKYTGPEGQIPELVASWIDTTGVSGITYTWDDSIRLYKILSQAGTVQIEAYGAPSKFRKLKSTISSDYAVAGNTLLTTLSGNWETYRDKLLAESSSTITRTSLQSIPPSGIVPAGKIPEEATIENVYLYWSGWIDPYYKTGYSSWAQIPALRYSQNTEAQLIANSKVGQVKFKVGDTSAQTVTANISGVHGVEPNVVPDVQVTRATDCIGSTDSWEYSCFKDITNLVVSGNVTVQKYIENAMKTAGGGTVAFTLGHADAVRNQRRTGTGNDTYYFALSGDGSTGYPLATPAHKYSSYETRYQWAYAGWSLIIFYQSPGLVQRQLYLYDNMVVVKYNEFTDVTVPIGNFLAPPVISENDKSHVTYFVGEGDYLLVNSKVGVNNKPPTYHWLSELPLNPENDVLNSQSSGLPVPVTRTDGVDIDTFVLPTGCILPYDTSAYLTLHTTQETYTLVYLVLSFRSELTTGGVITNYQIKIG